MKLFGSLTSFKDLLASVVSRVGTADSAAGATAAVTVQSGDATVSGASGTIAVESGESAAGASGAVTMQSGNVTGGTGNSGSITITTGTSAGGSRGNILMHGLQTILRSLRIQDATDTTKVLVVDPSGSATGRVTTIALSTATSDKILTLPNATTTLVGTDASQVITSKDIDGGTASNSSRITIPSATKATLDGLTRKEATVVYGTDTDKLYVDDGSQLKEIGSGSSGINYLATHFAADALGTVAVSLGDTIGVSDRTANKGQWGNSNGTAILTQSTSSVLRNNTNYLASFVSNGDFIESPLFTLDGVDLGKSVWISFDVNGVATADDVQVFACRYNSSNVLQERVQIAGTASATSPFGAQVPTGTTTFKGFFVSGSTSTDQYSIRWRRNASNTTLRLDSFIAGPQSQLTGSVKTAWQSYIPVSTQGIGTIATNNLEWARDSTDLIARGRMTIGTVDGNVARLGLPAGLSIGGLSSVNIVVGRWSRDNASATTRKAGPIIALLGDTFVRFASDDYTTASSPLTALNGNVAFSSSDIVSVAFRVPISTWSSNVTMAERAIEEFGVDTGGGDIFGANGATLPSIAAGTGTTDYTFTWPTTWQSTDHIRVEFANAATGTQWVERFPFLTGSGGYEFGCCISPSSTAGSGVCTIRFGNGGFTPSGGLSAGGSAWSALSASGWKVRVRKVAAGSVVGYENYFPVTTRSDSLATALGTKQYLHGTTYNGGNAPTVTCTAPTAFNSVSTGRFIPYQLQDGTWRMRFNIRATWAATQGPSITVTIAGVTFQDNLSISVSQATNASYTVNALTISASNQILALFSSPIDVFLVSGDVALSSKPTWAY